MKCSSRMSFKAETTFMQTPELDKFHKELPRLLELLAVQRRLIESQPRKLAPVLQHDERAEALFVLKAQQLIRSQAVAQHMTANRTPVDRLPLADSATAARIPQAAATPVPAPTPATIVPPGWLRRPTVR
jgi:hypothetical protein